jgi:CheY-like chemotaxis protein
MKVLVVEDDEITLETLEFLLTQEGHEVVTAKTAEKALSIMIQSHIDLLVTDLLISGYGGHGLLRIIAMNPDNRVPVVVLTALCPEQVDLPDLSNMKVLFKPVPPHMIMDAIEEVMEKHRDCGKRDG